MGKFSDGAINEHFLVALPDERQAVWRRRSEINLPASCQIDLMTEAKLLSFLATCQADWAPNLFAASSQGLLLEFLAAEESPAVFGHSHTDADFWSALAKIMSELHSTAVPQSLWPEFKATNLKNSLQSVALWLQGCLHPLAATISKEISVVLDLLPEEDSASVLCHNDFRVGNLLPSVDGQIYLLDWEFASFGVREQDVGWLFAPCWRYAEPEGLETDLDCFVTAYEQFSNIQLDRMNIEFWRYISQIRWSAIAMMQWWRAEQQEQVVDYRSEPQQDPAEALETAKILKENWLL